MKAEKLATAVYMITDIIDSREPLRWKMREEAMEIMSLTSTKVGDSSSRSGVLYRVLQAIERITHILSLAQNTKLISDMNTSIVMKEYADLKGKISDSWRNDIDGQGLKLDQRFFKVDPLLSEQTQKTDDIHTGPKRTRSDNSEYIGQKNVSENKDPIGLILNKTSDKKDTSGSALSDLKREEKKVDRRSVILSLLQKVRSVSVSDAMKELPGVSDKTVQRELVAMVEAGILEKKGEKRWSTYSLKP